MTSKRGVTIDRKVPLVKPQTAASTRTIMSSRTRFSKVSEQPNHTQVLKMVSRRELASLVSDLERLRRENELLLHRQETKFGVTVDIADALQHELAKTKSINNDLLDEIAIGKQKCDRLYEDFVQLQEKFEGCERKLKQYRREKKNWDDTKDKLRMAEDRCRRLLIKNKTLKYVLLKNGINPEAERKDAECKTQLKGLQKYKVTEKVRNGRKASPKTMKWI